MTGFYPVFVVEETRREAFHSESAARAYFDSLRPHGGGFARLALVESGDGRRKPKTIDSRYSRTI